MSGHVYLTGFMGSGKSAVGRALARRLRRPFLDTDAALERRAGRSVAALFARRGEAAFRALESALVRALPGRRASVVALGGGALLDAGSRRAVRQSGVLVRLSCGERELWRRLKTGRSARPLLEGPRPRERLRALLRAREAGYRGADLRVSTTRRSPEAAAAEIARRLRRKK